MKAIAGIYESQEEAAAAIERLKGAGYTDSHIILVNKDQLLHNHVHLNPAKTVQFVELTFGFILGLALGSAEGMGILDLPGLGEVRGAGVLLGAFIGSLVGVWMFGMIALATAVITNFINASKYDKKLNEGKFLLFLIGTRREIHKAHQLIQTPDLDLELE